MFITSKTWVNLSTTWVIPVKMLLSMNCQCKAPQSIMELISLLLSITNSTDFMRKTNIEDNNIMF